MRNRLEKCFSDDDDYNSGDKANGIGPPEKEEASATDHMHQNSRHLWAFFFSFFSLFVCLLMNICVHEYPNNPVDDHFG